jgi:DNA-binding MarR family transcriptional regulator
MDRDITDHLVDRWSELTPGIDAAGLQVTARLSRLGRHVALMEEEAFRAFGLNRGDVGVLGALRVAGPPYRLSPTRLGRGLMLSSAGVTSRLDRLERRGLLRRLPDPDDRRGVIVELTDEGRALVDEAVASHAEVDRRLLARLGDDEIVQLGSLLRKVLEAAEPPAAF